MPSNARIRAKVLNFWKHVAAARFKRKILKGALTSNSATNYLPLPYNNDLLFSIVVDNNRKLHGEIVDDLPGAIRFPCETIALIVYPQMDQVCDVISLTAAAMTYNQSVFFLGSFFRKHSSDVLALRNKIKYPLTAGSGRTLTTESCSEFI